MTDKTEAQPEALRVAAWLINAPFKTTHGDMLVGGRELRRLHAETEAQAARIAELEAHLSARQAAPDGWRLVPVASTAAMEWAFRSAEVRYSNGAGRMLPMDPHSAFKAQYRDMLSAAPPPPEREPLTDQQVEKLRQNTFSTDNPFCPCDRKTMQKAVRAAERAHGIGAANG
ncbi:hypothetical protein [Comamonas squillarum]|uniref:Uncharacterized protein n=1 Tax=Comamonas squillarum TaxID=2977320 RepID=A0ABY6A088_9BURK|nr:hypothetical protein [Comamonas sp. PR12]UXC19116.1 hypothetical protein N4T19_03040 [Comamonas sp. PR12]